MSTGVMLLPLFEAEDRKASAAALVAGRKAQIQRNLDSMRVCWPDWEGPIVSEDPEDVRGYCSISAIAAHNITHGDDRYSYCVPCRILEISDDGETFIVETAYTNPACHCYPQNGERWKIDITELWVPVDRLREIRNSAEEVEP